MCVCCAWVSWHVYGHTHVYVHMEGWSWCWGESTIACPAYSFEGGSLNQAQSSPDMTHSPSTNLGNPSSPSPSKVTITDMLPFPLNIDIGSGGCGHRSSHGKGKHCEAISSSGGLHVFLNRHLWNDEDSCCNVFYYNLYISESLSCLFWLETLFLYFPGAAGSSWSRILGDLPYSHVLLLWALFPPSTLPPSTHHRMLHW